MSTWTAMRWTGALWFLPALFALVSLIGSDSLTVISGYPTGDLAAAALGLCFAGPTLAGFTALRFRGFARFSRSLRARRRGTTVVVAAFWPLFLAAPLVASIGVVIAAQTLPSDLTGVALLALGVSTLAACGLLGIGLARALPVVLAVPVAVSATYFWLLFTPSIDSALLHNMTLWFPACCDSGSVPAPGALFAGICVALVICLGVAGSLGSPRWASLAQHSALVLALAITGSALGAGVGVVHIAIDRPSLQALDQRHTPLVCSKTGDRELCLWPENRKRAAAVTGEIARIETKLAVWGLPPMSPVSEAGRGDVVAFNAGSSLTLADVRYSLAAGYVDRAAGCRGSFGRWRDERVAFVALASGLRFDRVVQYVPRESVARAAAQIRKALTRPEVVRTWFERGPRARCGPHQ